MSSCGECHAANQWCRRAPGVRSAAPPSGRSSSYRCSAGSRCEVVAALVGPRSRCGIRSSRWPARSRSDSSRGYCSELHASLSQPQLRYRDGPGQGDKRGYIISDFTDDDARPDREESELLFGEAITWLGPEPPGKGARDSAAAQEPEPPPELELEPEPEPDLEPELAAAAAAVAPVAESVSDQEPATDAAKRRRRNLLIALGAAALVLVIVVIAALASGGGDSSSDVATGNGPTRTTAATTSTAPPTTPPTTSGLTTNANGTSVTVNADVLFDVGSSDLSPAASTRLGSVLSLAQTDARRRLLIEGFTDSDGDPTLNQQLSERRAQAVAKWLTDQGIDPARISVVGHGADGAIAPNDTPENKALNRRVVVTLQTATQ